MPDEAAVFEGLRRGLINLDDAKGMLNNVARETGSVNTQPDEAATQNGVAIAPDVEKSVVSGIPEGIARIIAFPGEVVNGMRALSGMVERPVQRGIEKVGDAVLPANAAAFLHRAYDQGTPQENVLPTTAEVKAAVNRGTRGAERLAGGPGTGSFFYEPQTGFGRLAKETVSGVTQGALMGGPFGALSGGAGGASSEVAGTVTKGTPFEGAARIVGGAVGSGIPSMVRYGAGLFRPGEVAANHLGALNEADEATRASVFNRAQDLIDQGRSQGLTLTGPEAIQHAMEEHGLGSGNRLGTLQRTIEASPKGEGIMAPVIGQRPGQVQQAGEQLLTNTFGKSMAPEEAANTTQNTAETTLNTATRNRTDLTQPAFSAARQETLPAAAKGQLDQLKAKLDAEIAVTGANNSLGKKLATFRNLLETKEEGQGLGPLIETNRTYAENLYKKYNPLDPENTFNNREVAALTPFNKELQGILEQHSPQYASGIQSYQKLSAPVSDLQEGPVGRLAFNMGGDQGTRLKTMADEFLDPTTTRPARIKQLINTLGKTNPDAVPQLIGARLTNLFNKNTRNLTGGANPQGGARFVAETMGDPSARANLRATIEALPNGGSKWAGWVKLTDVLKATGKRKALGSETAANLASTEELRQGANLPGRALANPLGAAAEMLGNLAARINSRTLAKVFVDPQSAKILEQMAILNPEGRRAQLLAGELSGLISAGNQGTEVAPMENPQNNGGMSQPTSPTRTIGPVSAADRDAAIRTIWGEARGEGPDGQAAVANVLLNRLQGGHYGKSLQDVVMAKNQFEPWNNAATRAQLRSLSPQDPAYQKIAQIFDQVSSGQTPDITNGATHFVAPQAQAALGRKMPAWANPNTQTAEIGRHVFFKA